MPFARKTASLPIERFFQFSLLGLVACAFCALADTGRLDLPSLAFLLAGLCWRGLMVLGVVRLRIPQRLITIVATTYLVFYPLDFYFISRDFFAATAHGVCFLGVARVLSARSNRDYLYTGSLAFVALMGAAALSTQMRFIGWMIAAIVFGLAALTSAEIRRGYQQTARAVPAVSTRTGWRLALLVGFATVGILTLTAGLFLIVPRTARAAAMLFPNGPRLTGFTNSIDLGGLAPNANDNRPILHVHTYTGGLPPNLKWRGSALSQFDGRRWSEPPFRGAFSAAQGTLAVADRVQRSRTDGARVVYRVDMASSDTGTLFIAGIPEFINLLVSYVDSPRLVRTSENSFRAIPALGEPIAYEVSAQMEDPLPSPLSNTERVRYLSLPPWLDHRISELGRQWTEGGADNSDLARANRIQARLHHDFTYTLDTRALSTHADPLADFLFVSRRGYCEYFASAMAVLLRTQKIPARVATGFQSGYFNDVSGSWVLRASDAHAWVEAWIEGRGWVTFDPTPPAVAPLTSGVWSRLGMYLDAADTTWQKWVVAYNPGQQAALAFAFRNQLRAFGGNEPGGWQRFWPQDGISSSSRSRNALTIAALLFAVMLGFYGLRLWPKVQTGLVARWRTARRIRKIRRGEGTANDASVLYEDMLTTLARRGFQKPPWFTPSEFARNLPPGQREAVDAFTATYNEVRFGGDPTGASRLAEMLERIQRTRVYSD